MVKFASLFGVLIAANAESITLEEGSVGTFSCKPPLDQGEVNLVIFEQNEKSLWFAMKGNAEAMSGIANEFTGVPSYSNKEETGAQYAGLNLEMTLPVVSLSHEGLYKCKSNYGNGYDINITVTAKPTISIENEPILKSQEGQLLKVGSCTAENGKPKATILWEDNDGVQYVGENTETTGRDPKLTTVTSVLSLGAVERNHHEKQFSCIVQQGGNEIERKTLNPAVDVLWKPENTKISASEEYLELTAASIFCESSANPSPQFTWSVRDTNKTLETDFAHWAISDDKQTISTEAIRFTDHSAEFICTAGNDFGTENTSHSIRVTERPKTTIAPETDEIKDGAGKAAMVYSVIGVIVLIVIVAACILLRRVLMTKKATYKTETDKDESQELNVDELETGKKKEYFM